MPHAGWLFLYRILFLVYFNNFNFPLSIFQFQHVMTGHWVTVKHSSTALVEPENFKVVLRQDAATESWFTLKPGSSFQKMGDPVSDTQEVVIESAGTLVVCAHKFFLSEGVFHYAAATFTCAPSTLVLALQTTRMNTCT
jgi:hypothetical protein